MPKVVFPCDLDNWWRVKGDLSALKDDCLKGDFTVKELAVSHHKIWEKNLGILEPCVLKWEETVFSGLVKYFNRHANQEETSQFLLVTFPSIIDLALDLEAHLPTDGIDIVEQQKGEIRELSRELCCCVVACGFLCLFPDDNRGWRTKLNQINFTKFFTFLHMPSQMAKLKCILHFIDRVTIDKKKMTGTVTFTRQVIKMEELPTIDTWLNCNWDLCDVSIQHEGLIEQAVPGAVEVDFANRCIGGGVLSKGRVQEEIRFTVCPELLVSLLLMETMEDNEAIVVHGYEQFSTVHGYASELRYIGDYKDESEVDEFGNKRNMLCAIDAVSYRHDNNIQLGRQYTDTCVLRDLNKAFTGFCVPLTVPSNEPGRKTSEDSFVTASTSGELTESSNVDSDDNQEDTVHAHVCNYVDNLIQRAITLALPDATKAISDAEELSDMPRCNPDQALQRQSSMDHLEINFRDWFNNYRRRSSNLSDLSSRRSSYDFASRRSSVCSAKGYSSEYSSEFEEYYENFQQEQKYKYHTIKEEVGSSCIIEFASNLAASLLQEGTREASSNVLSEFDTGLPSYDIQRPLPIRISTTSLSTVESVENEDAIVQEDCVRQFVDELFENVWPFDGSREGDQADVEIQRGFLHEFYEGCAIPIDENKGDNHDDDSVVIEDDIGEPYIVDEMVLTAVADHLVGVAFQEALLEYRYIMNENNKSKGNSISSVSESGQSEHSIDLKDQLDSKPNMDQAVKVAEKVMTKLFGEVDFGTRKTSSSPTQENMNESNNINIPNTEICDSNFSNLLAVDNSYTLHSKSYSGSEEGGASASTSPTEACLGLDGKMLDSSLTTRSDNEDNQSFNLNSSNLSSHSDSTNNSDDLNNQNIALIDKSNAKLTGACPKTLDTKIDSNCGTNVKNSGKEMESNSISVSPKKHKNATTGGRQRTSSQKSSDSGECAGARQPFVAKVIQCPDSTGQDGSQLSATISNQTSNYRPHSGSKSNKLMPPCQGRLKHVYVAGNRKNYDQFANSLSRDLLTNAFLQVQEHSEPVIYPRRSSEPMQISNGAALQRFEHSVNSVNGRHSGKSKTDEDISQFDDEWLQQFSGKSSSGFRDPVLSRFAEELMKVNVSVPPLQLPLTSDNVSISGSSHSVCSTISSFRDPLLASFEEELLSVKPSVAKTQMSWSKMKGSMCSPRQDRNSNSSSSHDSKKQMGISLSGDSENSGLSWRSSKSNSSPFTLSVSEYADMLSLRIICEALTVACPQDSKLNESVESSKKTSVSLDIYSDILAISILGASVQTALMANSDWLEQNKMVTWSEVTECVHYSEEDNIENSDLDISRERIPSCSESRSSGEYEDALDIPYQRLEEFADVLATKVLINSVAITKRENMCSLRRQYGRPIATGNWGCGAFGGDPHLKSLIQWMAASYAGCPRLIYYTFGSQQLKKFEEVVVIVQERGWDVSRLMQVVRRYCIIAEKEINEQGFVSRHLFDVILNGELFPGL
ncbi:hypothetical protein ACF0H5_020304 [Mactra antiquata]